MTDTWLWLPCEPVSCFKNISGHTGGVLSAKRDVLLPDRDVLQPAVPLWKVIVGAHADEKLSPSLRARRFSYMFLTIRAG
ncbi:MAG: hypothetical protein JO230_04545 [Xanthobacteraceae bacterium]|nr:hypothetical protein [Xanthobacteraceae bacterium]